MIPAEDSSLTVLIRGMQNGDRTARDRLFERAYRDLRLLAGRLMSRERFARTLGATGLLHEAIAGPLQSLTTPVRDRSHFYALATLSMRRLLTDQGRKRRAAKRSATATSSPAAVSPVSDVSLDLLRAIDQLRSHDPKAASVVEMRHLLGMTLEEIATETGRPYRLVREDWDFAKGWLRRHLEG